ncbi:hypothetical protein ABZV14_01185 [Streptosporangium canum]|uniref:hypothetical protein n=1 Tax=Streptosporangium canum TaxID=324952 RepID=UPI0033B31AFA
MVSPSGEGVIVPPHLCELVWRHLRAPLARHRADGGQFAPGVAELLDDLRIVFLTRTLEASGHSLPDVADISPSSDDRANRTAGLVSTEQLAIRTGVSDRHARRMARAAGYAQPRRGYWAAKDAAALEVSRHRRR